MRIRILWFGRPRGSPYEEQVAVYRKRVTRRWPAEDLALRPVAAGREQDPDRARAAEAEMVRSHLHRRWTLVALDEQGERLDSPGFARVLGDAEQHGVPGMTFVIGSDIGLERDLCAQADRRLSLSPLTLPHLLARLIVWEQLFRATHILGGGRYHRQGVQ